jgi:ATP-dependent RNA helicase DeaD
LGLSDELGAVVEGLGYSQPTPVQAAAIPALLAGRDVLGLAATGTGKTAAFALPMVEKLEPGAGKQGQIQGLVLAPTRELALQVTEAFKKYGAKRELSVLAVYGGTDIVPQLKRLGRGVDVVVATPGRALDHIRRKTLVLSKVKMVVLDEADEMLDLGFADDLEAILSELPAQRQTALFSATLPARIAALGERHLKEPVRVRLERGAGQTTRPRIEQRGYVVSFPHKAVALKRVLELEQPESAIIFCRTREDVEGLSQSLERNGHAVGALHGGLSQEQRDRVMKRFKEKKLSLLVATDVAARGLDVDHVTHVVNVDLPHTVESYVHRIGRTGRAGRAGIALSFVLPKERFLVPRLEQATQGKVKLLPVPDLEQLKGHRMTQLESVVRAAANEGAKVATSVLVERLTAQMPADEALAASLVALSHALHPASEDDDVEIPAHGPGKGDFASRGKKKSSNQAFRAERSAEVEAPSRESGRHRPHHRDETPERSTPKKERVERRSRDQRPAFPSEGGSRSPQRSGGGSKSLEKGAMKHREPAARVAGRGSSAMARLFFGVGKQAGIRPQDLVGAIANEANIESRQIGAIAIGDRHSFVEVAADQADHVIAAMRGSKIRGRAVSVDYDRSFSR